MKKIHARQLTLKKYSCYGLKKKSYKEFDDKKKFLRLENSPPPHNFFNGPSRLRTQKGVIAPGGPSGDRGN